MLIVTFGVLLLAAKIVFANKPFVRKYDLLYKIVIIFIFFFLLGEHFYETHLTIGMVALAMAFLAIVKYLFDLRRDKATDENENQ